MKKVLQKISTPIESPFLISLKDKSLNLINEHPEIFCLSLLTLVCLIFLFFGLNFYPLMDVDETRYAVMARDLAYSLNWNNLYLNLAPFLEKPPLYFWLVGASIRFFGAFTAFAVRFPIAILASFTVFFTYYVGKKVISRKFGMISALILVSSIFFLILSHIAILDMVLTAFVTGAIYCGFLTHYCEEKNKKYYWWYFYLFIGLSFLAKGILGLVIPFAVILPYSLVTKTAKEIFKPLYLLPGIIIFLAIAVPWHLVMYKEYGFEFIKQYFLVHHFARFINSESIGRERPFYYFGPVFILGFFPWSFAFIALIADGYRKIANKYKNTEGKFKEKICALFDTTTNEQQLIVFAALYFVIVFLLFSSSSTKLPTYILPVFPAAALLTGYYWWSGSEKGEHEKSISITTQIFAAIFIFASMIATVAYYVLPADIQYKIVGFKELTITAFYLLSILLILRLNTRKALSVFSGYVFMMMFVIMLAVSQIFNFVYATGQNEIVAYSRLAKIADTSLITFDFAVKPSVLVDYTDPVNFLTDPDFDMLDRLTKSSLRPTLVIIKNKNMERNGAEYTKMVNERLILIQPGEKYSLYFRSSKNPSEKFKAYKQILD